MTVFKILNYEIQTYPVKKDEPVFIIVLLMYIILWHFLKPIVFFVLVMAKPDTTK